MQADIVAAYRTWQQIEAVISHEAEHKARAGSRLSAMVHKLRGKGRR